VICAPGQTSACIGGQTDVIAVPRTQPPPAASGTARTEPPR
jgi:hypothetical protein